MKIWLNEISDFIPVVDGQNRLYRAGMLAKALANAGHQVLWWTSTFNHQMRKQRFDKSATVKIQENYHIRLLYGPGYQTSLSLNRLRHNKAVAFIYAREINKLPPSERPDIIYTCVPTLEVSEQAIRFGNHYNIPVVVDVRELWPHNYLLYAPSFIRPLFRAMLTPEFKRVKYIMEKATAIVGTSQAYVDWGVKIAHRNCSPADKCFFLGTYGKNIQNGETSEARLFLASKGLTIKDDTLVIVYAGMFGHLFDFRTVLKAAEIFLKSGERRVQFVFAGEGGDQASFFRKSANRLSNIHLTGWLNESMLNKILAVSSVGLAPYAPVVHAPTLPNKPFEYMSMGLPIISSVEGELRAIIEKEGVGLHYKGGNVGSLKDGISWFLSHGDEMLAMGNRAKELFKTRFDADSIYKLFAEHLNFIAQKNKV